METKKYKYIVIEKNNENDITSIVKIETIGELVNYLEVLYYSSNYKLISVTNIEETEVKDAS